MMIRSHGTAMDKLTDTQLRIKRQHNAVQLNAEFNIRASFGSRYVLPDTLASTSLDSLYAVIQFFADDVIMGMFNELRSNRVNQFTQHSNNNIT